MPVSQPDPVATGEDAVRLLAKLTPVEFHRIISADLRVAWQRDLVETEEPAGPMTISTTMYAGMPWPILSRTWKRPTGIRLARTLTVCLTAIPGCRVWVVYVKAGPLHSDPH